MMNNDDDRDPLDDDERDELEAVLRDMKTKGVRAAYTAALAICEDPNSPAPAKATAAGLIFRSVGMLDRKETLDDKPISELTAAELQRRSDKAAKRLREMELRSAEAQKTTVFD